MKHLVMVVKTIAIASAVALFPGDMPETAYCGLVLAGLVYLIGSALVVYRQEV